MINPNQLGRRPFPAGASQWMLVGLRGTPPPPTGLSDGDPVTTWRDSSVNGNDATMTGTNRPTFKTAIVNGKPVVRFTSAGLSKLNLTTPISGVTPWTSFAVIKQASAGLRVNALGGNGTAGLPFFICNTDNNIYVGDRTGYTNTSLAAGGSGPPSFGFHVLTGFSTAAPLLAIRVDGTGGITTLAALANTGNFSTIGYESITPTYGDGDIAEIIAYNLIPTVADLQNIEKYLGTKYGITVAAGSAVQPDTVAGLVGWWKADSLGT